MSILAPRLPGATVLDLFAGSGALGLEAISRGADHVTFVERSSRVVGVLQENVRALGADEAATIVRGDALRYLRGNTGPIFDLALADPPYREGLAEAVAARFAERPFARLLAIEHHLHEPVPGGENADQRRYGVTCLTLIHAPDER